MVSQKTRNPAKTKMYCEIIFISYRTIECSYGSDWMENGVRLDGLWPVRRHALFDHVFFVALRSLVRSCPVTPMASRTRETLGSRTIRRTTTPPRMMALKTIESSVRVFML